MDLVSLLAALGSLPTHLFLRGAGEEAEILRIVLFMAAIIGCGSVLVALVSRDSRG